MAEITSIALQETKTPDSTKCLLHQSLEGCLWVKKRKKQSHMKAVHNNCIVVHWNDSAGGESIVLILLVSMTVIL